MSKLTIDERGFIWYNGYRLPMRYDEKQNALEFCPKFDRRRGGAGRSVKYVYVPIAELLSLSEKTNDKPEQPETPVSTV